MHACYPATEIEPWNLFAGFRALCEVKPQCVATPLRPHALHVLCPHNAQYSYRLRLLERRQMNVLVSAERPIHLQLGVWATADALLRHWPSQEALSSAP